MMVKVLVQVKDPELDTLLLNQKLNQLLPQLLNPAAQLLPQLLPQNPAALRFPYCAIATLSIPISVNSSRIQTLPKTKLFSAATTKLLFPMRDQEPPPIKELISLPTQTFCKRSTPSRMETKRRMLRRRRAGLELEPRNS
jgi:hypothetical protein